MLTSLVPLALALTMAASPAPATPPCTGAADVIVVACPDQAAPQGRRRQSPPQKETGKATPEQARRKGGAGEQVRRYIGEQVPKIADWLFDAPSQSAGYEGEPLRNRGLRSVPPIAGKHFVSSHVTEVRDLGVIIAGAEPKIVYISSVLPSGIGSRVDIRPNDVIITLNGQPIETTQSFQTRFSRLPNGSPVEVGLRRGSQRFTVAFYKPSERSSSRSAFPDDRSGRVLPD